MVKMWLKEKERFDLRALQCAFITQLGPRTRRSELDKDTFSFLHMNVSNLTNVDFAQV